MDSPFTNKSASETPYVSDENRVTYFAETDSRNRRVRFGIKAKDRSRHIYVIGKTGMGKSTLLENLAIQDIQNGEGLAYVDPHGKSAELLLDYVPRSRIKDVLYFAPFDMDYPISFNVMEDIGVDRRHLVVSGLMSAFKKIWVDAWSARMEYILGNTLLALLEYPGSTLLGINRMLADKLYRKKVVENVKDPSVKSFWVDEFAKYTDRFAAEATPAIQNKVGQFISNPLIRNIISQPHSSFDLRRMMDERKIVILNLSKGRVGEINANLLGSMLITKIYLAAMSRADVPEEKMKKLPNFYLYVDEFQSFANESFADILSEARKYKLNLTIAHQYIEQMSEEVRAAVFGNVGTMVSFRVGALDAEILEKEFAPQFTAEDMVNLGFVQVYLKLMIDGISSQPFSAVTIPPIEKSAVNFKEAILAASREQFAHTRLEVEKAIELWHEPEKVASSEGGREAGRSIRQPRSPVNNHRVTIKGPRPGDAGKGKPHSASPMLGAGMESAATGEPAREPERAGSGGGRNESQERFKSDLKGFLKSIGQQDVAGVEVSASQKEAIGATSPEPVPAAVKPPEDDRQTASPAEEKKTPPPITVLRNDKKEPSKENLAGLRAALTAALTAKDKSVAPSPETSKSIPKLEKRDSAAEENMALSRPPTALSAVPNKASNSRAVSPEALRKILESD